MDCIKCSELKSYKRQDVSHKVSTSTIPIYNIKATFLVSSLYVYLGSGICLYFSPSVFEIHGKVKGDTSWRLFNWAFKLLRLFLDISGVNVFYFNRIS